jgi:hypothetical protein
MTVAILHDALTRYGGARRASREPMDAAKDPNLS